VKDRPVSAHDVAAYIVGKAGPVTAMKLQRLLYYCQAWSLVWDEAPLFAEPIKAWVSGPVVPEVYERNKGLFNVEAYDAGDASRLSETQRETVDAVLDYYGHFTAQQLNDLSRRESAWRQPGADLRDSPVIRLSDLVEVYGAIAREEHAKEAQG